MQPSHIIPNPTRRAYSLDELAAYIEPPTLSEEFPREQVHRLYELYPTQPWTQPPKHSPPQQLFPRALFNYVEPPFESAELQQAYLAWRTHRDSIQQMDLVLRAVEEGKIERRQLLAKVFHPCAVAALLHGLRAVLSPDERDRLINRAVVSTTGAYALTTTAPLRAEQWLLVLEQIMRSPRHLYHFCQLPHREEFQPADEAVLQGTASSPLYHALARHWLFGSIADPQTRTFLETRALQQAEAAFVLLAMDPYHAQRANWLQTIAQDSWWSYRLGQYWTDTQPELFAQFRSALQAAAMQQPISAYHWMRDVVRDDARLWRELYPSPFILDLAIDYRLSADEFTKLTRSLSEDQEPHPTLRAAIQSFGAVGSDKRDCGAI